MTREHLILLGFVALTTLVFVLVVRKGIPSRGRLWAGIFAMAGLSAMALGLHCYLAGGAEYFESRALPFQEMGLGVLFLILASIGCCCGGVQE